MPAAAGGEEPADLCPQASRIEEGLIGADGEKAARIECAAAYMACGRRHGVGGRLADAWECFERAVGLHGVWAECSDRCGEIAARLDGGGRLADAAVWYGKAAACLDREQDAGGPRDPRKEKKRRKRRSRWASECIRCWDALAGGAPLAPGEELHAAYEAADAAARGDDGARARMRVRMGDLELGRGRRDSAAGWYDRAMELEPGNKPAALGACKTLEQGGQWDAALPRYEKTACAIPALGRECAEGCARCARALESAGSPAKALSAIESAAKLDPLHALECADMHRKRADALAEGRQGQGQRQDAAGAKGGGREDGAVAHYEKAVGWYRLAEEAGKAGAGCARCARALGRMGLAGKSLSAIESAAKLDPLHALECADMHRKRADALAEGRKQGAPGAVATAGSAAESVHLGDAAARYEKAVEWYRRAGKAGGGQVRAGKAARGCARCARALGRMGLAGKALSAIEAAAGMGPLHALECAEMHRKRADALVKGRRGMGPDRGRAGGGGEAECAAEGGPDDYPSTHYEKAVEWYRRAGKAGGGQVRAGKAAKGCARCARALGRMGLAGKAQPAFEAAANLDGAAHALECGAYCKRLADMLAKGGNGLSRETKRLYSKALACYRTAADTGNPDAPRALRDSAAICMGLGQYDRAAGLFAEAYELGGGGGGALQAECIDGCCECVLMLAVAGDGKGAARCLERDILAGLQARSRCAEQCSARGRSEYKEERYEEAASCFEAAATIDGGDADAQLGAADSLARLGRHGEALERYRAAEKICGGGGGAGPEALARAMLGMAVSHEAAGRRGQAAACLARAAQADPRQGSECARRCLKMGRSEYKEERYEEAASCFEAAATIDGGDADAQLGAADSLARLGRHGEALERYRAAEKICGGGGGAGPEALARAMLGAADSLARLGRHGEALERYRAAEKICGGGGGAGPEALARAMLGMAVSHEAAGRRGQAAACLARAAQADPRQGSECARRCLKMGRSEYKEERYEEAASCFEAAATIDGGDADAQLGAADSQRMAGRSGDALRGYFGIRWSGGAGQRARAYVGIALILAGETRYVDAACLACMSAKAADAAGAPFDSAAFSAECAGLCSKWGDVVREQGRYDDAYACYGRALSADPGSAGGHCGMGDHMARRRLFNDALEHYDAALAADGRMVRALVGAGTARCELAGMQHSVDYQEAALMFARALEIDPTNYEACMGAGRACLGLKHHGFEDAVSHFCRAADIRPDDAGARMGAGKALRKLARYCSGRNRPEDAARCYKEAIGHYEHAMSSPDSIIVEPAYWKGVCMLHLEQEKPAEEFLKGVLDSTEPRSSREWDIRGRICDILGYYEAACKYYVESLEGSGLYTDGFRGRIDEKRIHAGRGAGDARRAMPDPAGGGGGGGRVGARAGGGGARALYVLDTNVVIDCAGGPGDSPDPEVTSVLVRGIKEGDCRIPQAAFDEMYGIMKGRDGGDPNALLREWGAELESIPGRLKMDRCMQRAREALMTAWLYSDIMAKKKWRARKFGRGKAPYTGGPPTGKDVVILATAAHLADADGAAGNRAVILVTSDADFLDFAQYMREVLPVYAVEPDKAASMLASAARERERQAEIGRQGAGTSPG